MLKGYGAGREHYEACCMKAVNQSIGRAIRHKSDFATVLLLDQRFAAQKILNLLPEWIMKSLMTEDQFPRALAAVVKVILTFIISLDNNRKVVLLFI